MKVLIATKNAGKIEGAKNALEKFYSDFEIQGIAVESNVPDQPVGLETFNGAKNRLLNLKNYAKENNIDADLFLSIESGFVEELGFPMITNIAAVCEKDGGVYFGAGSSFPVPERYVERIKEANFAVLMDDIFGEDKERHNGRGGVDLLTHGVVPRTRITELAFIMALTRLNNGEKWK